MKKVKYMLFTIFICFIAYNNVKADITCSYKNGNMEFLCDVGFSVSCRSNNSNITVAGNRAVNLKASDYKSTTGFKIITCNSVPTIYFDYYEKNGVWYYNSISKDSSNCIAEKYYPDTAKCLAFNYDAEDSDNVTERDNLSSENSGDSDNNGSDDSYFSEHITKPDDGKVETWNPKSFCNQEKVRGAFRAMGWILLIAKIVVPIIIIVFGCIDFGKAVTSSKDDEIKKAAKSLVIRAVIGIIVFLVPTIIGVVIDLINGNDIYDAENAHADDNSFGYCTYCLFHPSDDNCGSLMGGD